MKKEYKEIFNEINPDDELLESIFESTKKRPHKHTPKRILACAMCLAVIISGGFAYNGFFPPLPNDTANNTTISSDKLNHIIVAYASDDTPPTPLKADVETKLQYQIVITDIRNMSDDEVENIIGKRLEQFTNEYTSNIHFQSSLIQTCQRLDNAIVEEYTADFFDINIDNPNDIKAITVSNQSDYGSAEIVSKDFLFDEDSNIKDRGEMSSEESEELLEKTFVKGHKVTLDGERYVKDKALEERGGKCFEIHWKMDQPFYDALNENPNMDLSAISDIMTFTIDYKNGTSERADIQITFDSEGYMHAVLQ
ncbi:MAG: hypothetical protein K2H13_06170 [Eubacterium sp.]|nr:hypothetical protein [Eubacterium sp.]MDE6154922.1 hypothetical protein [Eubacterium sp.]